MAKGMTARAIRRSEISRSLKENKKRVGVVFLPGGDDSETVILKFWDDPDMLSELKSRGAEVVEVEEDLHGEIEMLERLAEELEHRKSAGEVRCADPTLLSNAIPNLVIKALRKSGRL